MTRAVAAMLLAYAVPGAGHFFLGRRARALAFAAIVISLFVLGVALDGRLYLLDEAHGQVITVLASLASMGTGALYFLTRAFGPPGDLRSLTFEYGRMFTLTAGLMNLLLVLDCWDIAKGRKT
ncbi:MAG TPA: DUF6677 family protein [Thermoanaerobaculia bacterium]|jgi:hypothetical protein|nr:DUF6677 family protein [Thermoanaerobaculia bacterium]